MPQGPGARGCAQFFPARQGSLMYQGIKETAFDEISVLEADASVS